MSLLAGTKQEEKKRWKIAYNWHVSGLQQYGLIGDIESTMQKPNPNWIRIEQIAKLVAAMNEDG